MTKYAKYLALVLGILAVGLLPVWAASLSITSVSIPTSVNLGESFTLTAQVSATSVNTGQAQLTLPSQISCTPTSAQSVTLSGGSGSASWNCTGSVAGDYSNQITVTVTDADGQAPQATSQTGLTVLAPASITASASTSVSSVDLSCGTSATFNYTVGVNNAGDIDASGVAMTPSVSGFTAYSLSPSSYSAQSVGADSLKNFHFIMTVTQTGTLNFAAITVTSTNAGSSTTAVKSVTIINSTGACPAAVTVTPAGGGTSYVAPAPAEESTTISQILAGQTATITVAKAAEIGISAIKIAVKNTVTSVKVTTTQLTSLPASISAAPVTVTGSTYKYVEITAMNVQSGDIDKVTLSFQVEKTWVTSNGINVATIAMNRWDGSKWSKLATTRTSDDSTYYYFEAESPGLSTFAVTGEKVVTPTTAPTPTLTAVPTAAPTAAPTATPPMITIPPVLGGPPIQIPVWLAVVVLAIIAYVAYKKLKSGEKTGTGYEYKKK